MGRLRSWLSTIYLVIGIFVAADHNYFKNIDGVDDVISVILAVFLWPLVIGDVNLNVNF